MIPGGCDHSYGIQVARLAGMPSSLIQGAKRVLQRLEQNDISLMQSTVRRSRKASIGQISLFESSGEVSRHAVLDTLSELDVDQITPVEALVKLQELKQEADLEE